MNIIEKFLPNGFEKWCLDGIRIHYVFWKPYNGRINCYCTHCKKSFTLKDKSSFQITLSNNMCCNAAYYVEPKRYCPECSAEVIYKSAKYEQVRTNEELFNAAFFCKQQSGGLTLRVLRVFANYIAEKGTLKRKPNLRFDEFMRYEFSKSESNQYTDECHNMGGSRGKFGYFCLRRNYKFYEDFSIYTPTLKEIIGTDLECMNNILHQYIRRCNKGSYDSDSAMLLRIMIKYPGLRHLWNLGFEKIIAELVSKPSGNYNMIYLNGKTVPKMLRCELSKLDKFDRKTLTLQDIKAIAIAIKHNIPVKQENLDIIKSYKFDDIYSFDIKLSEICKYLVKQKASVGDYCDYLRECKILEYNINLTEIKFPKSFNEAHTRTSITIQYKKDPEKFDKYIKAVKKWINKSYSNENLNIELIESPERLIFLAKIFHNCSAGYIDRIANGYCCLWLITKDNSPYYMLELNTMIKEVSQCRGINTGSGQPDSTPEVKQFTKEWIEKVVKNASYNNKKLQSTATV